MDLTKDNISTLIRQIAIPSSIGTLFQTLYNIVDVKFAGLISPDATTAIAKSFPIYFIIIGFTAGLSIGVTALISNALGKNDEKKASLLLAQAILTSLIISALVNLIRGVCILYLPICCTASFVATFIILSNFDMNSGLQSG